MVGSKRSSDPFERARSYAECVREQIRSERRLREEEMEYYINKGDYQGAAIYNSIVHRRIEFLEMELRDALLAMPPFLTQHERGYYERHPVTPDNEHILREAMRI